jgi:hypothetical protein
MNLFDGRRKQQPVISMVKSYVVKTFRTLNICSMWMSYIDPQSTLKDIKVVNDNARSE